MPDRGRHRRRPAPTAVPGPLRSLAAAVLFGAAGAVAATPVWGTTGAWLSDTADSDPVRLNTAPSAPAATPTAEPARLDPAPDASGQQARSGPGSPAGQGHGERQDREHPADSSKGRHDHGTGRHRSGPPSDAAPSGRAQDASSHGSAPGRGKEGGH
ncbi:hypothetical protein [Peterkaempfera griseoplana]|uniref:hypothetical protein n=1 Tax=Peterkaempfera griseoplana TaxID=66896 RepID=UPI0006E15B5C|nr:hypothetical protein [Peterkaempfera griseoplana]